MPSDLGPRLRRLIAAKGYPSVSAAARDCGLSRTQLWDIINGRKSPSVETLERILATMKATMKDLYC